MIMFRRINSGSLTVLLCIIIFGSLVDYLLGHRFYNAQEPASAATNSDFLIIGYLSGGRFANETQALRTHITNVTDVNFAFINPTDDGSGNLSPLSEKQTASLKNLVSIAQQHDRRVLLSFGGWRGSDPGYDEAYEKIAASDIARKHFIENIVELVEHHDVDGVDMDWEYPRLDTAERKYAQEYAVFIHELSLALHAKDKILTAAVIGVKDKSTDDGDGTAYLDSVLDDLDLVNLMAYDNSDTDHSPYELATASLSYWIDERGLDPKKAVLGLPLYARPGWVDYRKIIEAHGKEKAHVDSYIDPNTKLEGFYNGIPTIEKKTQLAIDRGLAGVMFWELPLDTNGAQIDQSLIKAARDVVEASKRKQR